MLATYTDLPKIEIQERIDEARALCEALENWTADPEQGKELLKGIQEKLKELDAVRKQFLKPALGAQKDINAFFRPALEGYQKAKDLVKKKLDDHLAAFERDRVRAMMELSKGKEAIVPSRPEIKTRVSWEVEITDLEKIPREYLVPDFKRLTLMAKQGEGAPPGVNFHRIEKVVA